MLVDKRMMKYRFDMNPKRRSNKLWFLEFLVNHLKMVRNNEDIHKYNYDIGLVKHLQLQLDFDLKQNKLHLVLFVKKNKQLNNSKE
jgi:hypothetical protein